MQQHTVPTHYAILIGINAYPENPLKGCVRDVQEIKKYIDGMPKLVHIQMFTASPMENSSSSQPAEDPEFWPTYDNVTSCLKQVTSSAKPGDFVYIHYSGHGTAIKPSDKSSSKSSGNLALVLLKVAERTEIRYLRGLELAYLLRNMVEKSLTVTLVLDCCFSGSVVRNDSLVRYLVYDPKIDAAYPLNPCQSLGHEAETSRPTYRAASMHSNWLANPDGYTILTACGPTEKAKEIILNGQRYGALSYYLLRTFAKLGGVGGKQQHIYHHLCARFRETRDKRKNEQNPMFYGNKSLCFFGPSSLEDHAAPIPIIKKLDGKIQLEAGQAHGISNGDRFAMYPLGLAIDDSAPKPSPVIVTVTRVAALTSDMEMVDTLSGYVETGWMATPLTRLSLQKFPIRLELNDPYGDDWAGVLREQQSLDLYAGDSTEPVCPFSFYVAEDAENVFEIRDEANQRMLHMTATTHDERGLANHVLDVVEHLAKFKLVQTLSNPLLVDPAHPFMRSFDVQLIDPTGKSFRPGCLRNGWLYPGCSHPECVIKVEVGGKLELVARNTGQEGGDVLYIHLYSLSHCWEIENILRGNHDVILPDMEWRKKLEMTVSSEWKEEAQSKCEDIIKVFLTVQPTSFISLELPELATPAKGASTAKTRGQGSRILSDNWVALNFRILCIK